MGRVAPFPGRTPLSVSGSGTRELPICRHLRPFAKPQLEMVIVVLSHVCYTRIHLVNSSLNTVPGKISLSNLIPEICLSFPFVCRLGSPHFALFLPRHILISPSHAHRGPRTQVSVHPRMCTHADTHAHARALVSNFVLPSLWHLKPSLLQNRVRTAPTPRARPCEG